MKDSLWTSASRWQAIGLWAALAAGCAQPAATKTANQAASPAFASCGATRCSFDLTISMKESAVPLEIVRRACHPSRSCPTTVGRLTDAGRNELVMLRQALLAESLAPHYGCPGCADGGVMSFKLRGSDGVVHEHSYDPRVVERASGAEPAAGESVPAAIVRAHAIFDGLVTAAASCVSTDFVSMVQPCSAEDPP
jgi:hypothetical protein